MSSLKNVLLAGGLAAALASSAQADEITFTDWTSNNSSVANYSLTIDNNTADRFNYSITIDPWNAEAIGLFLDLGDFDLPGSIDLADDSPVGEIELFASDTSSPNCGANCSLSHLDVQSELDLYDGEWEMIFRLGDSGFDGIQTFSFSTSDFGLDLSAFTLAGIRANQFCRNGGTLPDDIDNCNGYADKAYSATPDEPSVSEPGAIALLSLALAMTGFSRSRRRG